eukprot:COSAG06_NODE_65693_length_256_cov_0.732484_1_plen_84_part_11
MSFLEMSVNDSDRTPPRTPSAAAAPPPPPPSSTTELSAFARAFVEALLASASLAFAATSKKSGLQREQEAKQRRLAKPEKNLAR